MYASETPHRWLVVKITTPEQTFHKVFATWLGGYLDGDRWQMNSGISKIEEDETHYYFHGYSGSVYKCFKKAYGSSNYSQSVLDGIMNKAKEVNTQMEILSENTKWIDLIK